MIEQTTFDLILKGGRVIDPAQGIDSTLDIGITNGKVAQIGEELSGASQSVNVAGKLVIPG
ncbi:MAG: amidohydrolase/deacetylase family metallohydrolase, partial [Pseudomonadota bacterium]|nr:amidohydrolase/deacetylase family metallohydrolase [Pseudomonadota bacterium]